MKQVLIILLLAVIFVQCSDTETPDLGPVIEAEAVLYSINKIGDDLYDVSSTEIGLAKFSEQAGVVSLTITLTGMTPNTAKAVHIHSGTENEPGRHWNQNSFYASCNTQSLGQPWAKPFAGDVGNVAIDANGNGEFTIQTDLWALNSGDDRQITDLPIIIHNDPEDFIEECDPNHTHDMPHNNAKIAAGTIRLISEVEIQAFAPHQQMTVYPDFTICD